MRMLTENLGWKLLALLIAVVTWVMYTRESEVATSIATSLQYRNAPRDLEISTEGIDRVYLKVRGPTAMLRPAVLGESAITLDLAGINRPGERTFTIGSDNVHLPSGVQLLRVTPSQVRLHFDRRGVREIPVRIRIGTPPPKGYRIGWQQVAPARVRAIGPENRVRLLVAAETDPVDLGNTYGAAEFRVPVYVGDPMVRLGNDSTVAVRVRVDKIN